MNTISLPSGTPNSIEAVLSNLDEYTSMKRLPLLQGYFDRVETFGNACNIRGPVLYNPFGGVDLLHQFSLSDSITDVISHGLQVFGTAKQVNAALSSNSRQGLVFAPFDMNDALDYEVTCHGGIGHVALARVKILAGQPRGLYCFDLPGQNPTPAAMIEFELNGKDRRFWYFQQMLNEWVPTRGAFMEYAHNLHCDTLLIKSAHHWWSNMCNPEEIIYIALDPARQSNARVIADRNQYSPTSRPIWVPQYRPHKVNAREYLDRGFGYGEHVECGDGQFLITKDDPRVQAEMMRRMPGKVRRFVFTSLFAPASTHTEE